MITSVLRKKIIFNDERERDAAPGDWESAAVEFQFAVTPSGPED